MFSVFVGFCCVGVGGGVLFYSWLWLFQKNSLTTILRHFEIRQVNNEVIRPLNEMRKRPAKWD